MTATVKNSSAPSSDECDVLISLSTPRLLKARVMHKRLFPKINKFLYGVYYLMLPLSRLDEQADERLPVARNRFAPLSFYDKDHGNCVEGASLNAWARGILNHYNMADLVDGEIVLICMPRILGYVFNPVSFWLCHDKKGGLRAVIAEVNNTFGEQHSYLCAHADHRAITQDDVLQARKVFHVSPMLEREGHYEFRFTSDVSKWGVWIDFFHENGEKQLMTSLTGKTQEMTRKSLRAFFWGMPAITFKTIVLIHWQAAKLLMKGIKYISKPLQRTERLSATHDDDKALK